MSRSIIKKTVGVGGSALISRFFAYIREMLLIQFLGIGAISDAFFIALRVPNSLRKIFAEGALSSVLVPALVHAERKEKAGSMSKLLTLSFVLIEAIVLAVVIGIYFYADYIIYAMAPGASQAQLSSGSEFLKILAPFIIFLSSSAVLASALQATHRFFIPALAPAILNVLYVICLLLCLYFSWSVATFCWFMIAGTAVNFLIHVVTCLFYQFSISVPDKDSYSDFLHVLLQLFPCLLSVAIGEINFWIDSGFASFLESGTLSLLRYAYQFVNIPLGVMVTSLSIVLLPYFSKIGHSKKELGIYLCEALKFVVWMMLPITIIMIYSSYQIFETMFFSDKFTIDHVIKAQANMNAYLLGLTFFALEKILLNAFYALRSTVTATGVAMVTVLLNYCMNSWLMGLYGGMGLALATSITAALRIIMFISILHYHFGIIFHIKQLARLLWAYIIQLALLGSCFLATAKTIAYLIFLTDFAFHIDIAGYKVIINANFFLHSFGYWMWYGPLAACFCLAIYATRRFFGVTFSYIDEN